MTLSRKPSNLNALQKLLLSSAAVSSTLVASSYLFVSVARANSIALATSPELTQVDSAFQSTVASFAPGPSPQEQKQQARRWDITTIGKRYQPNRDRKPPSRPRTTTTGKRQSTCLGTQEAAFAMLGPYGTVGQTVSPYPKLVWHLPEVEGSYPVILRLLAPNEAGNLALAYSTILPYTPGINSFQLSTEAPALVEGEEYQWQVIVECDPSSPSQAAVQELAIERVAISTTLAQRLTGATTSVERASAYGLEGIWYDAIAAVAQATTGAENIALAELLSDLAATETEEVDRQNALAEIAEMSGNP